MPPRRKRLTTRDLIARIAQEDDRAVSRALSIIHDNRPQRPALLKELRKRPRHAHRIGVTGAQGVGKSTLITALTRYWGAGGKSSGVLAIDPTDPKTGGAQLGDRHAMISNFLEPWFFCRSLATRGEENGIVKRLDEMLLVFDTAKKDIAIVETIGAAQNDVVIRNYVDTLILVLVPTGNALTYEKAGLVDVADIFLCNRANSPGAQQSIEALRSVINLYRGKEEWKPLVIPVSPFAQEDIAKVADAIKHHYAHLLKTN